MGKFPKVTVVTPSLNQGQFIEETMLSVVGQDYPNVEHVVIDGGSTDNTIEILRCYEDKYNLIWISETDKGQSDAINKGFRLATGEITCWLNSDDTYLPGALSIIMKHLLNHPDLDWVYGDGYWINKDGKVLGLCKSEPFDLHKIVSKGLSVVQPTAFFKRKLLRTVGYLDTSLHYTMDTDFFIRLAVMTQGGYIPSILATRRLHDRAKTISDKQKFCVDRIVMLQKLYNRPDLPPDIKRQKRSAFSSAYYGAGCAFFVVGQTRKSGEYLRKAILAETNPFRIYKIKCLLLLLQCYLRLRLYIPGQRRRKRRFPLASKDISIRWTERNNFSSITVQK